MESFDMFRQAIQDKQNYANQIAAAAKSNNPTLLDTTNIVDFSNPDSVARMQGLYASPFYNNMNNPNFMYQQQSPYSMSNPYGPTYYNPGYMYGRYNNNGYNNTWNGYSNWGSTDLSFMDYSEDQKKNGSVLKVTLSRGKHETQTRTVINNNKQSKPQLKGGIIRTYIIEDKYGKRTLTQEEYEEYTKPNTETEYYDASKLQYIQRRVISKGFGREYLKKIHKLAKDLAVYDEARALCLIGSIDDAYISKVDFEYYLKSCEDKLVWYQTQEKINPEKHYRVPLRYRRLPMRFKDPKSGRILYSEYKAPNRRKFKVDEFKIIDFFDFDRGREPNKEEWQVFYAQAEYERDNEIVILKAKAVEEYEQKQRELYIYNRTNPMDIRLHELKVEEKKRQDQYDFFRAAYGTSITDEQFNEWWYRGNLAAMPQNGLRTEQQMIQQRNQWANNMNFQHIQNLGTFTQIDPNTVREWKTHQIQRLAYDFDRGTMDNCKDLKDVFDNLGYLNIRVCEENIERQRREDLNSSLAANRYDYNQYLMQAATWYNTGVADPQYTNRPHYMDFVNSRDYEENKRKFYEYCTTSSGSIPLKPIYK